MYSIYILHIFQSVHLGRALDTFFVCNNAEYDITPVECAKSTREICQTSHFIYH